MPETFAERLDLAMQKKGIKFFSELAKLAQVSPNSLTTWVEKGSIPRPSSQLAVCNALGVRYEWLQSGKGPMEMATREEKNLRNAFAHSPIAEGPWSNSPIGRFSQITDPHPLGAALSSVRKMLRSRNLELGDESESELVLRVMRASLEHGQDPTEEDAAQELIAWVRGD